MKLFSDGLYMISRFEMYPTDGEGSFFWSSTRKNRLYETTADLYYKFHVGGTTLKYLYPSQPLSQLNEDTINYYVNNQIDDFTAFVYSMNGSIGLVLDGHHRITGACLQGEKVNCLGITQIDSYLLSKNGIKSLWAFGQHFEIDDFNQKEIIKKLLLKNKDSNRIANCTRVEPNISDVQMKESLSKELDVRAAEYPRYRELAFEHVIQERSFNRLEYLWKQYDEKSLFEFEILIGSLFRLDKKRSYDYIVKLIFDEGKSEFHELAYKLLLTYEDDVIEDVLVNYLVEVDYDRSDPIRILIDDYFRKES